MKMVSFLTLFLLLFSRILMFLRCIVIFMVVTTNFIEIIPISPLSLAQINVLLLVLRCLEVPNKANFLFDLLTLSLFKFDVLI